MFTLGVLALLVAAAASLPTDIPKDDKVLYRCVQNVDQSVYLKGIKVPFYVCNSEAGDHFVLAAEGQTDSFEARLDNVTVQKLRDLNKNSQRIKRQFGTGFSNAGAQASSGSFGGGFGGPGGYGGYPGGYGGGPGVGFGGGFSQANAFSNSGAGGFGK